MLPDDVGSAFLNQNSCLIKYHFRYRTPLNNNGITNLSQRDNSTDDMDENNMNESIGEGEGEAQGHMGKSLLQERQTGSRHFS